VAIARPGCSAGSTAAEAEKEKTFYTINRQAGVLTLNATAKQHELVSFMLEN